MTTLRIDWIGLADSFLLGMLFCVCVDVVRSSWSASTDTTAPLIRLDQTKLVLPPVTDPG